MSKDLEAATNTYAELLRLHRLNDELLETLSVTLHWIEEYAEKQKITLPNQSTLNSLLSSADAIINEIASETTVTIKYRR